MRSKKFGSTVRIWKKDVGSTIQLDSAKDLKTGYAYSFFSPFFFSHSVQQVIKIILLQLSYPRTNLRFIETMVAVENQSSRV